MATHVHLVPPPSKTKRVIKYYADDTTVYVIELAWVNATINLIEKYGLASESKINKEKTKILLCGTLIDEKAN